MKDKDTHSLGPWRVENNDDIVSIIDYHENVFAHVRFEKVNPKNGILFPIDENVRLIAAAPSMLYKLKELQKIISNLSKLRLLGAIGDSLYHDLCSLDRFIAKIEGDE